jgi:hypothetical protein
MMFGINHGIQCNISQNALKKVNVFHMFNIWTNLWVFLMELFVKKEGDVMNDINVHFQKAYMP